MNAQVAAELPGLRNTELCPDDVIAAVHRVLTSPAFETAPQARRFLAFVADETIDGRGHLLNERKVARLALGRAADFDARTDPSVRVQARRVRDRLDRHYLADGRDDPIRVELPLGQYAVVFSARRSGCAGRRPNQATARVGLAVVRFRSTNHGTNDRRIAVALSESLVHAFTNAAGVRVAGPFGWAGGSTGGADVFAIGERSRASVVLHGRVREMGDVVRVTVQLADARTGEVLWSDECDQPTVMLSDFGAEDAIIARIVGGTVDAVDALVADGSHLST
jgi:TolB-like protein